MKRVLVIYGTTEGHTRTIAERVGEWVRSRGFGAEVVDSAALPEGFLVAGFDAYIVAGSLHEGKHQRPLRHFVHEHAAVLNARPSAFLSASLCAAGTDEKNRTEAQACIVGFLEETRFRPTVTTPVAGALLYTQYDFLKRFIMRAIVRREGGDTDTSHDYEYTDWAGLERFVSEFLSKSFSAAVAAR